MMEENGLPKGWVETTLGEVVEKMYSGGTPSTNRDDYYNGNIPWIRTQEVTFNRINDTDLKITELGLKNSSAKYIPINTVIVAMYGNSAGRVALSKIEATTNQACCNIVTNPSISSAEYIFYNLLNRYEEIKGKANGAAQQNLNVGILRNLEIILPPLPEQKAIASILISFDDKIELLQAQNETLETIAQTIFKEWFGKYQVGDELPEGWRVGKLGDLVEYIIDNRGKTPPLAENSIDVYPLVEVNSITGGDRGIDLSLVKKYVDKETYKSWFRKGHPINGDILLSTVGSIGQLALIYNENVCIAQNIIAIRSNVSESFLYELLKLNQRNIISLDISSVQPSIKVPHLLSMSIIIPKLELIQQFHDVSFKLTKKIMQNNSQIQTLQAARDTLLPKLMSGLIRVSEFKEQLSEVM